MLLKSGRSDGGGEARGRASPRLVPGHEVW